MTTKPNNNITVPTARKRHTEATRRADEAQIALTEAESQLDAALAERHRLDAELDRGADIDSADLAAQIAANNTTTEALDRLANRRRNALTEAHADVEQARKHIALAELLTLQADVDAFDIEQEKAGLLALVQEQYSAILERLYGFQDRLSKARQWSKDAQGLGVQVTPPNRFSSDSRVTVQGRPLREPEIPSYVVKWFKDLVDEREEAAEAVGREENRRRVLEAQRVQAEHRQAMSDAIPTGSRVPTHLR